MLLRGLNTPTNPRSVVTISSYPLSNSETNHLLILSQVKDFKTIQNYNWSITNVVCYIPGMRGYNMSKIIVAKGLQAEIIMANMSASILRNIVASVLKVDSRNIKLSGEISTEMVCENWSGNSYDSRYDKTTILGFTPEHGLRDLQILYNSGNYNQASPTFGDIAFAFPEQYQDCIFFVIIQEGCTQMQNPEDWDYYNNITVYKAPNFQQYFASIEEAEIARWEQWLNEE